MKKLILDLDTGVDDALAISYALGSPEVELIGITGTYGNVLVEQGVRNALAVTDLLGHPEVKVYQGQPHSSTVLLQFFLSNFCTIFPQYGLPVSSRNCTI